MTGSGPSSAASATRRESAAVAAAAVTLCALQAWLAGQDANWDLRNYHVYIVDAWLHGRTFWNLGPAQIQSWLNPLPHLLQVLLILHAPPVLAGMLLGGLAGVNVWLVWLLTRRMLGGTADAATRAGALAAAAIAISGPMFASMLGASWAEYVCSPFVLLALLAVVPGTPGAGVAVTPRAVFAAGAAMGLACGLKLTHLIYALGLLGALGLTAPGAMLGRAGIAFAAGGAAGYLATGGFWAFRLWRQFGSPIFPYFNAVFRSPMIAPVNWADDRFLVANPAAAAVAYPFQWLAGQYPSNELPFRDPRFAVLAVLLALAAVAALRRQAAGDAAADGRARRFWFLALFFLVSYGVWLVRFGVQRFALPLELCAAVAIAAAIGMLLRGGRAVAASVALALSIAAWTQPAQWGRVPYGRDWFQVSAPHADPSLLYVMVGHDPIAFVIPFLPRENRFVRVNGNNPLEPDRYLGREAARLIREHRGPIRTLSGHPIQADDRRALAAFGLAVAAPERCDDITTVMGPIHACDVVRQP